MLSQQLRELYSTRRMLHICIYLWAACLGSGFLSTIRDSGHIMPRSVNAAKLGSSRILPLNSL